MQKYMLHDNRENPDGYSRIPLIRATLEAEQSDHGTVQLVVCRDDFGSSW